MYIHVSVTQCGFGQGRGRASDWEVGSDRLGSGRRHRNWTDEFRWSVPGSRFACRPLSSADPSVNVISIAVEFLIFAGRSMDLGVRPSTPSGSIFTEVTRTHQIGQTLSCRYRSDATRVERRTESVARAGSASTSTTIVQGVLAVARKLRAAWLPW